jgi:Cd2+/Zn2+-exporting ATPase
LQARNIHLVMLTGDNTCTAQRVAKAAGLHEVQAELLPQDKLAAVDELLGRYGTVGMVGDGVNDAPALARSSMGFAMGAAGSDTAIETADVALMQDDLRKLPVFIELSERTAGILRQNITLAIGIKVLFFGLALAGKATLWMAVFADIGTTLLVIFNALRLLRFSPRQP